MSNCAIIKLSYINYNNINLNGFLNENYDIWINLKEKIGKKGSILLFGDNSYDDENIIPWPLIISEHIIKTTNMRLKNIFIWYHSKPKTKQIFYSSYSYIIYMVNSLDEYYFNKNVMRKEHIFKDIEWGGKRTLGGSSYHNRKVRRYSENGRDPGNVFYNAKRDKEGRILDIYDELECDLVEKLIKMVTNENSIIYTNIQDDLILKSIINNNRVYEKVDIKI